MAIQLTLANTPLGVAFENAYFRIVSAIVSRTSDAEIPHVVSLLVKGYACDPGNNDLMELECRRYAASLADISGQEGADFLAQCYAWVMLQADMAGGTAV